MLATYLDTAKLEADHTELENCIQEIRTLFK